MTVRIHGTPGMHPVGGASHVGVGAAGRDASSAVCRSAAGRGWGWKSVEGPLARVRRRARGMIGLHFLLVTLATQAIDVHAAADPMAPPRVLRKGEKATDRGETFTPAPLLWTWVGAETSLAWYGGRMVQVGSEVDGVRIEHIAEDHVTVSRKNRRYRVPLLTLDGVAAPQAITPERICKGGNPCPMPEQ